MEIIFFSRELNKENEFYFDKLIKLKIYIVPKESK